MARAKRRAAVLIAIMAVCWQAAVFAYRSTSPLPASPSASPAALSALPPGAESSQPAVAAPAPSPATPQLELRRLNAGWIALAAVVVGLLWTYFMLAIRSFSTAVRWVVSTANLAAFGTLFLLIGYWWGERAIVSQVTAALEAGRVTATSTALPTTLQPFTGRDAITLLIGAWALIFLVAFMWSARVEPLRIETHWGGFGGGIGGWRISSSFVYLLLAIAFVGVLVARSY